MHVFAYVADSEPSKRRYAVQLLQEPAVYSALVPYMPGQRLPPSLSDVRGFEQTAQLAAQHEQQQKAQAESREGRLAGTRRSSRRR